jgi:hypothetical protein
MSNKYYDCDTSLANVATALTNFYGVGVTIHASSATSLYFTCAAISDKVIKILLSSSQLLAYYGTAYVGSDITDSVTWGGSSTAGSVTKIHLCLTPNAFLLNALSSTQNSKMYLICKLSNGAFAVFGSVGSPSSAYNTYHYGYLTATQTPVSLGAYHKTYKSSTGKIFRSPLVVFDPVAGATLVGSNALSAMDLYACSVAMGDSAVHKGSDYFVSTSNMYVNGGGMELTASLLVGDIS